MNPQAASADSPETSVSRTCPVCLATQVTQFFTQLRQPTQCGYLAPTREQALAAPLGDITLQHCHECGHIWNSSFDPRLVGFSPEYDLSQFYSPAYRRYAAATVDRLADRYGLRGKTALEIACGKGDFLRLLLEGGVGRVIGFDPTFIDPGFTDEEKSRIVIHRKFYDMDDRALRPDLIVCRGCIQYVPRPREFLKSVRNTVGDHLAAIVYFQASNSGLAFRDKTVWYVMYEAGCFFTAGSLARIFRECGFQVLDILPALDDSHFDIETRPATAPTTHQAESREAVAEITAQTAAFANAYAERLESWSDRFKVYRRDNKRVVMWAAGMRAISLLSNCPEAASLVEAVVDVNAQRQGRYLPKTGQRVISPNDLPAMKPDVVLCTNPTYADEIAGQVVASGLRCEFAVLN